MSAVLTVLVIQSRKPFFKRGRVKYLLWAIGATLAATLMRPSIPLADVFRFTAPPVSFLIAIAAIMVAYVVVVDLAKVVFYKKSKA